MDKFYICTYFAPVLCALESFVFHIDSPKFIKVICLFFIFQSILLRYWSINSLGRYWTRKCIFIDGLDRVQNGPYRFLNHPEYISRIVETICWSIFFFAPSVGSILVIYLIYLYLKITKDELQQVVELSVSNDIPLVEEGS